ncbi:MAG: RtcB family protein [Bryobacteraceae bacterium]
MSKRALAPIACWLAAPMDRDVREAIHRLRAAPGIVRVAVMPDVHLAAGVCIGVAAASSSWIYPQAVGGDIGCGMLAVGTDVEAAALDEARATRVLTGLAKAIPARRRNRHEAIQPPDATCAPLSHPRLDAIRRNEAALKFATLGSGNHFLELQADEEGRLWLMIHSGSRVLGPAVRDHYLELARPVGHGLFAIEVDSDPGAGYLHDAGCARAWADASRRAIAREAGRVLADVLGASLRWESAIATDHNHVALERHGGVDLWVHRKGAMRARGGEQGVLPGSMGSLSYHVEGRGYPQALCSSAHGAGRLLSRTAARAKVTERDLARQMADVWYNTRLAPRLLDEAPSAYKDIRAVLRAQRDLTKVIRTLRPVLNYKGV